jgi:hypothetical protein
VKGKIGPGKKKWLSCEFPANSEDTTINLIIRADKFQDMRKVTDGADARITSIGFRGLYICETDDMIARANFGEAILLDELQRLESGPDDRGAFEG